MERDNKKSKRIGMTVSIVLHVIFLLLALFTVSCWTSKGPPLPGDQIGIQLSFGEETGRDNSIETEIEKVIEKEEIEEVQPVEEEIIEDLVEEEIEEEVIEETTETESVENTYDNTSEVSYTEKKEPKKIEPKKNVYIPSKSKGDTEDEKGIKGDPNSPKKAENVYTNNSGGGGGGNNDKGLSLSLNGWKWEAPPKTKEITHSGEVEFTFVVTEDGEVLDITVIKSSFTPAETETLKNKLYDIAFLQTSNGAPPAETEGRLIWKFVAK